jgi:site-specific recombinase XerD
MKVSQAIKSYQEYHRVNSKKNTRKNYRFHFTRFSYEFSDRDLESITPDEILSFLTRLTEGTKQTTKRNRYSSLKAFF